MDRAEREKWRTYLIEEVKKGVARGWAFTPISGKIAYRQGWNTEAPLSLDQLIEVARWKNLGLRTGSASGIAVLDDDSPDGSAVAHLDLPTTVTVITGSGKRHYYFRAPEGGLPNSASKVANGVDIRADGGQAAFPGSLHQKTGKPYIWAPGLSPDDVPIAPFPEHILERIRSLKAEKKTKSAAKRRRSAPKAASTPSRDGRTWSSLEGFRDELKNRIDICEVIEGYADISASGMAVCPLHDDHDPSLSVSAEKQLFHCFGCQKAGDVFNFIMEKEALTFMEALKHLAEQAGMEPYRASREEIRAAEEEREIADILTASAFFYSSEFRDPKWEDLASEYSWPDEHREKFELGWAEGGLKSYLINLGFPLPACLRAGVLVDRGGEAADALMGQLVLPVRLFGRVTALIGVDLESGAATVVGAEGAALPLFNEGSLDSEQVYLVTDVLDALALEAWGFPAVAILAPGFDPKRVAEKLGRAERVTICCDAGRAPWPDLTRLGALFGAKARTVEFPEGRPPSRMLAEADQEAFDRCVAEARDPIAQAIEAIPADTAKVDLPDLLAPVLEALADLPHAKAEAYLTGEMKGCFKLKGKDLDAYRRMIRELRTQHRREALAAGDDLADASSKYSSNDHGTFWNKTTRDGPAPVKLANFSARIAECVTEDDGAECLTVYKIEVRRHGQERAVRVPAASFAMLSWVHEELGPEFIVEAGMGLKDHMRTAIQYGSGSIQRVVRFSHIGWRKVDKHGWLYLSACGPLGPEGPVSTVEVALEGALACYALALPIDEAEAREVVRASMEVLELGQGEIFYPLFASIWRAALGGTDFAIHLAGPSGTRKTATAAVIQAHWGSEFDERRLPGSWSSTGNALEEFAFKAKDAIFVIDDFAPTGTAQDQYRTHREADRVLRNQGNLAGRSRMNRDGTTRAVRPPRGMILSTGEDVPVGQSLRARTFVLEISPNTVNLDVLTRCQKSGRAGKLCKALAAYARWVASDYEKIRKAVKDAVPELRAIFQDGSTHGRTSTIAAELLAGFDVWKKFAVSIGAVENDEAETLRVRCLEALGSAAQSQGGHVSASEPTGKYLELLAAAMASSEAHLVDADGNVPKCEMPGRWGWRAVSIEEGGLCGPGWRRQGKQVGWVGREFLFLDPVASLKAAKAMTTGPDCLVITERTLGMRLWEKGLLLKKDPEGGRHTYRKNLEGARRRVWVLKVDSLLEITGLSGQDDEEGTFEGPEGPKSVARNGQGTGDSGPDTGPHSGPQGAGELGISDSPDACGPEGPKAPDHPVGEEAADAKNE